MPGRPAARLIDPVTHPLPPVLTGGPGSPNVLIGMLPAWRGIPAVTSASIQSAKRLSDTNIKAAEKATVAAAGTPGAPAAKTAEETTKTAAAASMGTTITSNAGGADIHSCTTLLPAPPHGPGLVIDGSPTVLINNLPACRQGDTVLEAVGPPNKIVMGCPTVLIGDTSGGVMPLPPCGEAWNKVNDEINGVLAQGGDIDPIERNKHVSKAYAQMYLRNPDFKWIGLGAIVSRQGGCAMGLARDKSDSIFPLVSGPASTVYNALADTNKTIFQDIYSAMRFYEMYGMDGVDKCGNHGSNRIHSDIHQAIWLIDTARELLAKNPNSSRGKAYVRYASDKIAEYEQTEIVENEIYSDEEVREAFADNEWWARRPAGRWAGARKPELSLSSRCGGGSPVPFDGSITNAEDRVGYYHSLMGRFENRPEGWNETMYDIISQAEE